MPSGVLLRAEHEGVEIEVGQGPSRRPRAPVHVDGEVPGAFRYLLVTDGGEAADAAGEWMAALCRTDSRIAVTVLYVFEPPRQPLLLDPDLPYVEPVDVACAHESREALARMRRVLALPAWRLREAVAIAGFASAVLAETARHVYRGVVVGRAPAEGWRALFQPDPARILLRRLTCALIVVPAGANPAAGGAREASVKNPAPNLHAPFPLP